MSNLPNDPHRYDPELVAALERIDAGLAELFKLKAEHAFTVFAHPELLDTWIWVCRCGNFNAIQYPPHEEHQPIGAQLLAHIREVEQ